MSSVRDQLARIRRICLSLPEATEKKAWGEPTFRVRGKMFAMCRGWSPGHGPDTALWCKASLEIQQVLVDGAPKRYFVPRYVGHKGWVGVQLDVGVDWAVVSDLVEEAYRTAAPKRLASGLDERQSIPSHTDRERRPRESLVAGARARRVRARGGPR